MKMLLWGVRDRKIPGLFAYHRTGGAVAQNKQKNRALWLCESGVEPDKGWY